MLSLFIFNDLDMYSDPVGGVQLCSQEFLEIIQTASKSIEYFEVSVCRQLLWRTRRKLHLGSYLLYNPEEYRDKLLQSIQKNRPSHVFINKSELIRFTPMLRELLPDAQIILMSHGNQSGDDLYELAGIEGNRNKGLSKFGAIWQIGQDLTTESWYRHRYVDCVCVMSEEEEVLERWLGAKNTIVLPRAINLEELSWNPISGRVGFVGTLNHTPNRIALEQICEEISKKRPANIELRLVGQPASYGQALASRFDFVSYLGALNDDALKSEVSSWNLFLNPIFWLSRGASMKLGKAISWGIPFVTTYSGKRGYKLTDADFLTTPDNVEGFVSRLMEIMSDNQKILKAREIVKNTQINSPSIHELSDIVSTFLCV
jgi:Glycosyl transferases group 1